MTWEEREGGRRSAGVFGSPVTVMSSSKSKACSDASVPANKDVNVEAPEAGDTSIDGRNRVVVAHTMMTRTHSDQGIFPDGSSSSSIARGDTSPNLDSLAFSLGKMSTATTASSSGASTRHRPNQGLNGSLGKERDQEGLSNLNLGLTSRPRHRHHHESERGTEVRGSDGSWAAARPEEHDEWSMARRRASRAGLESVRGLEDG